MLLCMNYWSIFGGCYTFFFISVTLLSCTFIVCGEEPTSCISSAVVMYGQKKKVLGLVNMCCFLVIVSSLYAYYSKGRILCRNWDKSLKSFPTCYSQVTSTNRFYPPPSPREKVVWNWFVNVNIVYGNLKSENSPDYAHKPQRNCAFMKSALAYAQFII